MRVLVLSLYYPPLNAISALRIQAFVKQFEQDGIEVDVITRYYSPAQCEGKNMLVGSQPADKAFTKPYIREGNILYTNFNPNPAPMRVSRWLPPVIKGLYNYSKADIFHYGWLQYMHQAFDEQLSTNKYDYIIASYGPPVVLLGAYQLSKKHNIPWIADFRDIYIDERDSGYHLRAKKMIQHKLLGSAAGLTFSTEAMYTFFLRHATEKLKAKPHCFVYNGIEKTSTPPAVAPGDEAVAGTFHDLAKRYRYVLLHTGTLYQGQNIAFFVNLVAGFNAAYDEQVALVFLGITENNSPQIPASDDIYFLPRVAHTTSLYLQHKASALVLPVWEGRYTGFSGKTQEYLASGNHVLCGPDPQADLGPFFNASGNVTVLPRNAGPEDIFMALHKQVAPKENEMLYRAYWTKKLVAFLNQLKKA